MYRNRSIAVYIGLTSWFSSGQLQATLRKMCYLLCTCSFTHSSAHFKRRSRADSITPKRQRLQSFETRKLCAIGKNSIQGPCGVRSFSAVRSQEGASRQRRHFYSAGDLRSAAATTLWWRSSVVEARARWPKYTAATCTSPSPQPTYSWQSKCHN